MLLRHPPVPTIIHSPTLLHTNAEDAKIPINLQQRILTQLSSVRIKVSRTSAQQQALYKRYFNKKAINVPVFTAGQIYVNCLPLALLAADMQTTDEYNTISLHITGPRKMRRVSAHVLTIKKNEIAIIISTDKVTAGGIKHRHCWPNDTPTGCHIGTFSPLHKNTFWLTE